ncbi:MAG: hypothetical protein HY722_10075 [Planctomycetes bacterium]|nr:hypothetical protein [Planctomycetota bacterium]
MSVDFPGRPPGTALCCSPSQVVDFRPAPDSRVRFQCERCRRSLVAHFRAIGLAGICRHCRQRITIGVIFSFVQAADPGVR